MPHPIPATAEAAGGDVEQKQPKLVCVTCGRQTSHGVASFCLSDAPRFGGLVYCMDCQKKVPKAG